MLDLLTENAPIIGLLMFVTIFAVMAIWTMKPDNKEKIESHRYIPLTEDYNERSQ